jgi:hypothetical protein
MLCEQVREHLSAYLDKELTAELTASVVRHLDACAECRTLLDELRATADLLGRLPVRTVPPHIAQDVQRQIERQAVVGEAPSTEEPPRERTIPIRRVQTWPRVLAVAATIGLAAGIGILAYLTQTHPAPREVEVRSPALKLETRLADGRAMSKAAATKAESNAPTNTDADVFYEKARSLKAGAPRQSVEGTVGGAPPAKAPEAGGTYSITKAKGGEDRANWLGLQVAKAPGAQEPPAAPSVGKPDAAGLGALRPGAGRKPAAESPDFSVLGASGKPAGEGPAGPRAGGGAAPPAAESRRPPAPTAPDRQVGQQVEEQLAQVALAPGMKELDVAQRAVEGKKAPTAPEPASLDAAVRVGPETKPAAPPAAPGTQIEKAPTTPEPLTLGAAARVVPEAKPVAPPAAPKVERQPSKANEIPAPPSAAPPLAPAAEPPAEKPAIAGPAPAVKPTDRFGFAGPAPAARPGGQPAATTKEYAADKADNRLAFGTGTRAVQRAMEAAAAGEARLGDLKSVATPDNLTRAEYQLVLMTDSRRKGDQALEQLFRANGWQAVDRANAEAMRSTGVSRPEGTTGFAGYGWGSARAHAVEGPRGVYYAARQNGEDVWVVLTDLNSLNRFAGQVAEADNLTVSRDSSRPFQGVRTLQEDLRHQAAVQDWQRGKDTPLAEKVKETEDREGYTVAKPLRRGQESSADELKADVVREGSLKAGASAAGVAPPVATAPVPPTAAGVRTPPATPGLEYLSRQAGGRNADGLEDRTHTMRGDKSRADNHVLLVIRVRDAEAASRESRPAAEGK